MTIRRIGKYSVVGRLGTGAHSTILHIKREEDGRSYALKIVPIDSAEDRKFLDQAQHEFRIAQMLEHVNLIKVHTLETESNWMFKVKKVNLLIEFVQGSTLDTLKSLSLKKLVPVFVQVATGLVHMHRRGVFHADMKPSNIIVNNRTGQAKIIDYGLAWVKGEGKEGRIQGTPEYLAPETVMMGIVNERTDIFNFGSTMYRMLTFQNTPTLLPQPGTARINAKTFSQLLKPIAEVNAQAPKELCNLVHSCLEFQSENRPERMSEVQGALDRIADEIGPPDDDDD